MSKYKRAGPIGLIMLMLLLMLMLSACVGSDEDMARFLVAPGKFDLYTCPELGQQVAANAKRQRELEQLITKAGQDPSGQLVSALAYRPEYLSVRGEMREVRAAAVAKRCNLAQIDNAAGIENMSATRDAFGNPEQH